MKARPTKTTFRNLSEQNAKKLALILGAVLLLLVIAIALFPLLDRAETPYEVTTYAMGSYCSRASTGKQRGGRSRSRQRGCSRWKTRSPGALRAAISKS